MSEYRKLTLADPLMIVIGRIGYPDEGLRLTICRNVPYKFSTEIQLSRSDVEWLVAELQKELENPGNDNMPD